MVISVLGRADSRCVVALPLYLSRVSAGFPSPAADYIESTLDLNELCVKNPAATYFVRVSGDSMMDAGINSGDILVVDRSLIAKHGDIVIASLNGELTCKQLQLQPVVALVPCNPSYQPIEVSDGETLDIYGVVTSSVRSFKGG